MTSKDRSGDADKQRQPSRQYLQDDDAGTGEDAREAPSPGSARHHIHLDSSPSINPAEALRGAQRAPAPHHRTALTPAQEAVVRRAREADYQIGERMARGAESVLYHTVGDGTEFCVKAIRNWLGNMIGEAATRGNEGKLEAAYRAKVRHLHNEFEVGQELQEAGEIPVVRIYALRKVRRLGFEIGYDLLMEFIDGVDLADKQAATFTTAQKVNFFYQTAKALQYMHRRSFIHLDMKPSNVMIRNDEVKLIDFGVTVSLGHKPRAVTGTVGYLSPEQIARDYLDQATDLFALGVTFAVVFGGNALRQEPNDLKSRAFRNNARYLLEHDCLPIIRVIPELRELPKIAELISNCTIPCRDQRLNDAGELAHQILRAAQAAGIEIHC